MQSPTTEHNNIGAFVESSYHQMIINTEIGKFGGINGIISDKKKLHRTPESQFLKHVQTLLNQNINILLTHDTPALPIIDEKYKTPCIGQNSLYSILKGPLIHIYGHCHHSVFYHYISGIHFINPDARVIIVTPRNCNDVDLFITFLTDLYL